MDVDGWCIAKPLSLGMGPKKVFLSIHHPSCMVHWWVSTFTLAIFLAIFFWLLQSLSSSSIWALVGAGPL